MSDVEVLLQRYLKGGFEIDISSLSNEDKIKYQQTMNLLDGTLKAVNNFLYWFSQMQTIKTEKAEK